MRNFKRMPVQHCIPVRPKIWTKKQIVTPIRAKVGVQNPKNREFYEWIAKQPRKTKANKISEIISGIVSSTVEIVKSLERAWARVTDAVAKCLAEWAVKIE